MCCVVAKVFSLVATSLQASLYNRYIQRSQCCIRTCSINVLDCIDFKTDIKSLAHLALLRLPMVWFRASNKVLYVGSCTTYNENGMMLYEKASRVKAMENGLLYVLRMMLSLK